MDKNVKLTINESGGYHILLRVKCQVCKVPFGVSDVRGTRPVPRLFGSFQSFDQGILPLIIVVVGCTILYGTANCKIVDTL